MKLFIKLMILVVILAMAGPFIMKGPDGKPLLTLQKIGIPSLTQIIATARNGIPTSVTQKAEESNPAIAPARRGDTFYKWQDKNGVWQFTSEPPPSPTVYNEVHTDTRANIIQSLSKDTIADTLGFSSEEKTDDNGSTKDKPADEVENGLSLTTVPMSQIPQLMDDAKMARELMEERKKTLDQALGNAEKSR